MRTNPNGEDVAREMYQVLAHYKRSTKGGIPEGLSKVCEVFTAKGATTLPVLGHFAEYVKKFVPPAIYDDLILTFRGVYKFNEFKFADGQPHDKSAMLDIRAANGPVITGWSKDDFMWACDTHRAAFGPERLEAALTSMFGTKDAGAVPYYAYGTVMAAMAQEMAVGAPHKIVPSTVPYHVGKPTFGKRNPLTGQPRRRKFRDNRTPPEEA